MNTMYLKLNMGHIRCYNIAEAKKKLKYCLQKNEFICFCMMSSLMSAHYYLGLSEKLWWPSGCTGIHGCLLPIAAIENRLLNAEVILDGC